LYLGETVRAEIVKISSDNPETSLVTYAAEQIKSGQVLGMPTDTFYGLAADPFNLRAVERVYEIKSRSRHKPLSLLIESEEQAEMLARDPLPDNFYILARKFWPGPLTIIVPAASRLPLKVTANTGNIAIRIPEAKIPLQVIRAAGVPITATSANLSGESECTTAGACANSCTNAFPSSSTVAPRPVTWPPPSSISAKTEAGDCCARVPSRARKSPTC